MNTPTPDEVAQAAGEALATWDAGRPSDTDDWPNEWYIGVASRLAETLRQALDHLAVHQERIEKVRGMAADARRATDRAASDDEVHDHEWEHMTGRRDALDEAVDALTADQDAEKGTRDLPPVRPGVVI